MVIDIEVVPINYCAVCEYNSVGTDIISRCWIPNSPLTVTYRIL